MQDGGCDDGSGSGGSMEHGQMRFRFLCPDGEETCCVVRPGANAVFCSFMRDVKGSELVTHGGGLSTKGCIMYDSSCFGYCSGS